MSTLTPFEESKSVQSLTPDSTPSSSTETPAQAINEESKTQSLSPVPESLASTTASNQTTAEPLTPKPNDEQLIEPPKKKRKDKLKYLLEIGLWYTNMEGAGQGGSLDYQRGTRRRTVTKSLEQKMLENANLEKEERRAKNEAKKKKLKEELEKKLEEEAALREQERQIRERLKEERAAKRELEGKSEKHLSESPKPQDDDLLVQRKKSIKTRLVHDYLPFFSVHDDVELPLRQGFFIKEIYDNSVTLVEPFEFKSAAQAVQESPSNKYKNYKNLKRVSIYLKSVIYPNLSEEYDLIESRDLQLDPLEEIGRLMELNSIIYFPEEYRLTLYNPEDPYNSLAGKYGKAFRSNDYGAVLKIIEEYNSLVSFIHSKGGFVKHLQEKKTISRLALHEILNQIYSRSVSPNVAILNRYKGFSNFVYGELMPKFLSKVFDQVGLNENSTFIDLGSGVGNVTLQTALEFGCESYGCEIMENCSLLSDLHAIAFEERCKYFGLNPGNVKLFNNQSFVGNKEVKDVISKCDVILVNNFLFSPDLSDEVMKLFDNLKKGTKIISLKTIIPDSHIIDFNDIDNYKNKFEAVKYEFGDGSVSWTSRGGIYYITEYTGLISERAIRVHSTRSKDRKLRKFV